MNPDIKKITLVLLLCYDNMAASFFYIYPIVEEKIKIPFGLIGTHLQNVIEHWFMIIALL